MYVLCKGREDLPEYVFHEAEYRILRDRRYPYRLVPDRRRLQPIGVDPRSALAYTLQRVGAYAGNDHGDLV